MLRRDLADIRAAQGDGLPTSQKEAMSFAMVDLPLPEGPTRAFTVPSRKVRSMPWSTSVSP